jgi:hypothetical protein
MFESQNKIDNEKKTVGAMISIYCRSHHNSPKNALCESCRRLLNYSIKRIDKCVFGQEKPSCEKCPIHCYKPKYRDEVKTIMRYAGPRMLYKHPILALKHILQNRKSIQNDT